MKDENERAIGSAKSSMVLLICTSCALVSAILDRGKTFVIVQDVVSMRFGDYLITLAKWPLMKELLSQGRRPTPKVSVCAKHLAEKNLGTVLGRLEFFHHSRTAQSCDVAKSHSFP